MANHPNRAVRRNEPMYEGDLRWGVSTYGRAVGYRLVTTTSGHKVFNRDREKLVAHVGIENFIQGAPRSEVIALCDIHSPGIPSSFETVQAAADYAIEHGSEILDRYAVIARIFPDEKSYRADLHDQSDAS